MAFDPPDQRHRRPSRRDTSAPFGGQGEPGRWRDERVREDDGRVVAYYQATVVEGRENYFLGAARRRAGGPVTALRG